MFTVANQVSTFLTELEKDEQVKIHAPNRRALPATDKPGASSRDRV